MRGFKLHTEDEIKLVQLLFNQEAYNFIESLCKQLFDNFDMDIFANRYLSAHELFVTKEQFNEILNKTIAHIGYKFPIDFKEDRQHYAYELFIEYPPEFWGSRGAPSCWAFIARQYTYDKLPIPKEILIQKYKEIVKDLHISMKEDNYEYISQFSIKLGMSDGVVGGSFLINGLNSLLKSFD